MRRRKESTMRRMVPSCLMSGKGFFLLCEQEVMEIGIRCSNFVDCEEYLKQQYGLINLTRKLSVLSFLQKFFSNSANVSVVTSRTRQIFFLQKYIP